MCEVLRSKVHDLLCQMLLINPLRFEFHPSILLIKNKVGKNFSQNLFCFNEVTKAEVLEEINSINNKKANSFNTIPSKILKISCECSADTLTINL